MTNSVPVGRSHLECPVCLESFNSKIYQCCEGHVVCEECKIKIPSPKKCPSCRKPLGDIRNRVLEDLVKDALLPCRNEPRGCKVVLSLDKRLVHEKDCKFSLYRCPHPDHHDKCKWIGDGGSVRKHFEDKHCSVYVFKEVKTGDERDQWVTGHGPWISQNSVGGMHFLVYKYKKENRFMVAVQYLGNASPGYSRVRVELKNGGERVHQSPISSIRGGPSELSWFDVPSRELDLTEDQKVHFFITITLDKKK
eukprot:188385_1